MFIVYFHFQIDKILNFIFVVTGLSLVMSIVATALVCIFYTTIGGMKAVVWNDVVQVCKEFVSPSP